VAHCLNNITKILIVVLMILVVALSFPRLSAIAWPDIPPASPTFDCDDATLAMYRYFEALGIESTPVIGNLKMDGEDYMESNHVWLLVKLGDREIAYDWGTPRFDRQHHEGYRISLDFLLSAVAQDKQASGELASRN
jgi:hypothetical protein